MARCRVISCCARVVALLVTLSLAALMWLSPVTAAAQKQQAAYHVTFRVDASMTAKDYASGSGTVSGELTATGFPGPGGEAPTTFTGEKDPVAWTNVNYTAIGNSAAAKCIILPDIYRGSFRITLMQSAKGTVQVHWIGLTATTSKWTCGPISQQGPGIQPFLNVEPTTFTLPAAGGTEPISGTTAGGGFRSDGTISVTLQDPCDNKATEVTDVVSANGEPSSLGNLKGTNLYQGQTLTAEEDVQLAFADGSFQRFMKGTKFRVADCSAGAEGKFKPVWDIRIGRMWVKDSPVQAPRVLTPTQVVLGIRGTEFWVSYANGVETVHVSKGSVWMQRLSGDRLVGKRWIVTAGQTATVRRTGPVTVHRTGEPRPRVRITSPANKSVTQSEVVTVQGTVSDSFGIWSLKVDGKPVAVGRDGHWKTSVTLQPGANTITTTATNLAGGSSSVRTMVTYRPHLTQNR